MATKNTKSAKQNRPRRFAEARDSAKIPLWMVMGRDGKDQPWQPYAAYGSRLQAEVYASGCSDKNRVKIVAGAFSPNAALSGTKENHEKS